MSCIISQDVRGSQAEIFENQIAGRITKGITEENSKGKSIFEGISTETPGKTGEPSPGTPELIS